MAKFSAFFSSSVSDCMSQSNCVVTRPCLNISHVYISSKGIYVDLHTKIELYDILVFKFQNVKKDV